ncbi:E3 ubiquitin-protein ligase SIRP1-like [Oryza brachyantha]|uniref:RING-type domain-containing protein n=1 Tax=Oryza brachyantha TaxID=4533 RepID=J3MWP4_ORYBR|nr:E3 ubiquitin-protein ligase SIRP1-like [Oryza brachyantha]
MSGRRPDGSYGPEYGPQPLEQDHGLYHHWPSRGRAPWPLYHGRDYPGRTLEQRVTREPFGFSRILHINGSNLRPRQENPGLTGAEFEKAMEQLKKQVYMPSDLQKTAAASKTGGRGLSHTKNARSEPIPNNMEEEKACTICLETFLAGEKVVATPCNHIFHQGCITPWVKGHGSCPVCRFMLCERNAVSDNSHSSVGEVEVDLDLLEMMRAMEEVFSRVTFSNFMPYH